MKRCEWCGDETRSLVQYDSVFVWQLCRKGVCLSGIKAWELSYFEKEVAA